MVRWQAKWSCHPLIPSGADSEFSALLHLTPEQIPSPHAHAKNTPTPSHRALPDTVDVPGAEWQARPRKSTERQVDPAGRDDQNRGQVTIFPVRSAGFRTKRREGGRGGFLADLD